MIAVQRGAVTLYVSPLLQATLDACVMASAASIITDRATKKRAPEIGDVGSAMGGVGHDFIAPEISGIYRTSRSRLISASATAIFIMICAVPAAQARTVIAAKTRFIICRLVSKPRFPIDLGSRISSTFEADIVLWWCSSSHLFLGLMTALVRSKFKQSPKFRHRRP